jgi:acetoin utilization protein AcuB
MSMQDPRGRAGVALPVTHVRRISYETAAARQLKYGGGMSKPIPPVRAYMTTTPHSIGVEQPLAHAHKLMRELRIRHLPVLHGGKLVGVLSDRDLHLIETLQAVDPNVVTVEEAMTPRPYEVDPDAPLDEVVRTMAEHRYGCAIVTQNRKTVGVFTTTDACRALAELLHGRLAK